MHPAPTALPCRFQCHIKFGGMAALGIVINLNQTHGSWHEVGSKTIVQANQDCIVKFCRAVPLLLEPWQEKALMSKSRTCEEHSAKRLA